MKYECGKLCNDTERRKSNYSGKNLFPILLCPPKIRNGLVWGRTQYSGFNPKSVHVRFAGPSFAFMITDRGKVVIFLV